MRLLNRETSIRVVLPRQIREAPIGRVKGQRSPFRSIQCSAVSSPKGQIDGSPSLASLGTEPTADHHAVSYPSS
jgi:hypothetical protein